MDSNDMERHCFIFDSLPIDRQLLHDGPYQIESDLFFERFNESELLNLSVIDRGDSWQAEQAALAYYCCPGLDLPGYPARYQMTVFGKTVEEANVRIWKFLFCLRLVRPLRLLLLGGYSADQRGGITNHSCFSHFTYFNEEELARGVVAEELYYHLEDVGKAIELYRKIDSLEEVNFDGRFVNLLYKTQEALLFERVFYFDNRLALLFGCLDAMACNPKWHHKDKIPSRIANLLHGSSVERNIRSRFGQGVDEFIKRMWDKDRSRVKHFHPPRRRDQILERCKHQEIDEEWWSEGYYLQELVREGFIQLVRVSSDLFGEYDSRYVDDSNQEDAKAREKNLDEMFQRLGGCHEIVNRP